MNINEYLRSHYCEEKLPNGVVIQLNRPRVKCKDGFEFSAQASFSHYCHPRKDGKDTIYTAVELGYPNRVEPLILGYNDGGRPTKTAYGYVPVELVDRVIEKHGGIANE